MKIVTNDYSCGTSSSILDYGVKDVVIVSEHDFEHVFEVEDDLFFIGHDFLFYLWNSEDKLKRWMSRKGKYEHWVWCFERIDAIIKPWIIKSHTSLAILSNFCDRILACDEDDCDRYGFDWLPQWASCKFYDKRGIQPTSNKILFSGQAGGPEYAARNSLLRSVVEDSLLSQNFEITNTKRSLSWEDYVDNLLKYNIILNPVGTLKALNTRAYEVIYSNRVLLQHKVGNYRRHQAMLKSNPNVVFFDNINDLKRLIERGSLTSAAEDYFALHSLHARMKSVGVEIN